MDTFECEVINLMIHCSSCSSNYRRWHFSFALILGHVWKAKLRWHESEKKSKIKSCNVAKPLRSRSCYDRDRFSRYFHHIVYLWLDKNKSCNFVTKLVMIARIRCYQHSGWEKVKVGCWRCLEDDRAKRLSQPKSNFTAVKCRWPIDLDWETFYQPAFAQLLNCNYVNTENFSQQYLKRSIIVNALRLISNDLREPSK